jgi:hypothetical protein
MLEVLNTYRSFLYRFLLVAYLLSVFQVPAFELIHLLSHAHQINDTHTELHSYTSHHEHDHEHRVLQLLDDSTSENEDHSNNIQDIELKKKAEIHTPLLSTLFVSLQNNTNNFGNIKKPTSLYQHLVSPPPQFFYSTFL